MAKREETQERFLQKILGSLTSSLKVTIYFEGLNDSILLLNHAQNFFLKRNERWTTFRFKP